MSSVREQLIAAAIDAWNTSPPTGVPNIRRDAFQQIRLTSSAPIDVRLFWLQDEERPDSTDIGPAQLHDLVIGIEARAIGDDSAIPEQVLDPVAVYAAKTFNDNRLGGLAQYLRVKASQIIRDGDQDRPLAKLQIALLGKYVSAVDDFETT